LRFVAGCATATAAFAGFFFVVLTATQELARHKDLRTTQGYLNARLSRVLEAAVRLERK
jgi:hypothetical protein